MDDNEIDSILAHYGVLGMKWGVRKKSRGTVSEDYTTTASLRKKSPKELSNKELQTVIERKRLESQFKDANASQIDRGRKAVIKVVGGIGTAIITGVATKEGMRLLTAFMKRGG